MYQSARILVATSLFCFASFASATDYYVDSRSGNDSNEGSEQHPFRTLAPLLARLTACDNAYVKIEGAANDRGVGRYSHAALPGSGACAAVSSKSG